MRFAFFFLLTIAGSLKAQNLVHLSGNVKSAFDHSAIAYATVKLSAQEIYTASNADGYWEFNFKSSSSYDSIKFTALGFKPKTVAVSGFRFQQEVLMEPSIVQPGEMLVLSGKRLTSKQIVEKAVARISENYADTFKLEAYFREYQKIDDRYISFTDASVEITDDQFSGKSNHKRHELINILAVRKSFRYNDKGYSSWADSTMQDANWLTALLSLDEVRNRGGLLAKSVVYDTIGFTNFNDKLCYEIKVLKKQGHYLNPKSSLYRGYIRMIIDPDDFGIYRITDEEHSKDNADKKQFIWGKKISKELSARATGGTRIVEFKKVKGKLVLSQLTQTFEIEDFTAITGATLHTNTYSWQLFVNKVYDKASAKHLVSIKDRKHMTLSYGAYDRHFWEVYNMIPLTAENLKAFNDLGKKSAARRAIQEKFFCEVKLLQCGQLEISDVKLVFGCFISPSNNNPVLIFQI